MSAIISNLFLNGELAPSAFRIWKRGGISPILGRFSDREEIALLAKLAKVA
jgi:hypothetical protein